MGEEGEIWREYKEQERRERNERQPQIIETVNRKLGQLARHGHAIRWLTDYQIRIDNRLDIYWVNQRWHDLKKNERGSYQDLTQLIKEKLCSRHTS